MEENTQNITKKERRELRRQEKTNEVEQDKRKGVARKLLAWVFVLGLIAAGVYALVSYESGITDKVGSIGEVRAEDWTQGNQEAPAVLIEYSDFQCPACSAYEPIIQQLVNDLPNELLFVYRHFPLTTIHSNAEGAAWASEAAGRQGQFWEMHDIIFANQEAWSNLRDPKEALKIYANELGLDLDQFDNDYESDEVRDIVSDSLAEARAASFSGTPTFILNGEKLVSNPQSLDAFKNLILKNIQ